MTSRYTQGQAKERNVEYMFYFGIILLFFLDYRMGLFGQTPQKTPKEQVCRVLMKDDLKHY